MPPKLADSKYTDTIFGETHTDIHYRFWLSLPVNREYIEKNYAKILTEQTSSLNLIKENTEKFLKDEYEKAYHSFYEYRAAKNNLSTDKRTSYKKAFHLTNHWVKCQCVDKKTFSCFENQKFHLGKKQLITTSDKNDRLCLPRSICFMASIIDSNNENVFASFGRLHLVDFVLLLFSFVFDGYDKNNPYLFFELIGNNYYPKLKGLPTISKDEKTIFQNYAKNYIEIIEVFTERYREGKYHLQLLIENYYKKFYDYSFLHYASVKDMVSKLQNEGLK